MSYVRSKRYPELFKPPGSSRWSCFIPNPEGGKQLRVPTRCRDERAAHEWYLARVRAPHGPTVATQKERTLRDALAARVEWLKSGRKNDDPTRRKLSAQTIDFYDKKSSPLIHVLGASTLLSAIGHEDVRRYITVRSETVKANTIGKELTTLSCAMRLARKDGVACAVFKDIVPEDFKAVYVPKDRWLTEAEVDALLGVLPAKRGAVVAFIVATSASYPSEVAPVRPSHVKGHDVHLPGTKRGTRNRHLKVPSHARRYLDLAVKHLTPSGFERWTNIRGDLHDAARLLSMCQPCRGVRLAWARHEGGVTKPRKVSCRACKATPRFAPLSPNDLRRTFAQWLVRSGVPHELTYPMMGHSSPKMLEQVYGKRDARAVADLVEIALETAPKGARNLG